jgi:hypothetical protein
MPLLVAAVACAVSVDLQVACQAGEAKLSGLQFSIGQPQDAPAARVSIAEVRQGAQKKGFLRVAILPSAVAKGVEIRFERPEPSALGELSETLRMLVKLDAQELNEVSFFVGQETAPRLIAAEAFPAKDHWVLKKVRLRSLDGFREVAVCKLVISGDKAGLCTETDGTGLGRLNLERFAP